MSDYLPRDVLVEILARLPVRSLVRFIGVCKSWYSLITSPNFITKHLNSTTSARGSSNRPLFVRHYYMFQEIERFALHSDTESFDELMKLECPFRSVNDYFRIVGLCNGLICLSDDHDSLTETILVWNPSIRRSVTLPKPSFPVAHQGMCFLGFGLDSPGADYKVVRTVYEYDFLDGSNYRIPPNVEIYTLSTGAWKSICHIAPQSYLYDFFPMPSLFNGAVHWVASNRDENGSYCNLISAFDMGAEKFREISLPADVKRTDVLKLSVSVLGTSLALTQYEKIWESSYCWIWVMKEYGKVESWTKQLTIDMRDGIRKVAGFRRNNEVLLSARVKGLVSCDVNSQRIKYLGIHGTNRSFYVDTYVESLVLLKAETSVLQQANSSIAVISEGETAMAGEKTEDKEK